MEGSTEITHLSLRAGFGLTMDEFIHFRGRSPHQLFDAYWPEQIPPLPDSDFVGTLTEEKVRKLSSKERLELRKQARKSTSEVAYAWFLRMAESPVSAQLIEKVSLFWHGHFACRIENPINAVNYLNALRQHGLGNFRDLVLAIARNGAMINYLNNQQNRKDHPNENFARELLELFTIGRGHYTEQDVREAARAFTGWSANFEGKFIFQRQHHDFGVKTFMGHSGNWDGEDIIDLILEQRASARFIASRIYHFFVNSDVDEPMVDQMADLLFQSGYELAPVFRFLFTADHFYQPRHLGSQIKSPVAWLAGLSRAFQYRLPPEEGLGRFFRLTGQMLFNPPNVAGWPGGRAWVDNASLQLRVSVPLMALDLSNKRKEKQNWKVDWETLMQKLPPGEDLSHFLATWLLAQNGNDRQALISYLDQVLAGKDQSFKVRTVAFMATPEYQMA